MLDYFYGGQTELFSLYRLPKVLFTDPKFRGISAESKILHGLLLDRMILSIKSGWLDKQGRVYIIFTADEIMEALCCADNKATNLKAIYNGKMLSNPDLTLTLILISHHLSNERNAHSSTVYIS